MLKFWGLHVFPEHIYCHFHLFNTIAPVTDGKVRIRSGNCRYDVIAACLDSTLGSVILMASITRSHSLVRRIFLREPCLNRSGSFIIYNVYFCLIPTASSCAYNVVYALVISPSSRLCIGSMRMALASYE